MRQPHRACLAALVLVALMAAVSPAKPPTGGTVRDIAVDGNTLHAVGEHGLWLLSRDDGRTWTRQASPDDAHWEHITADGNDVILLGGRTAPGNPLGAGRSVLYRRQKGDANATALPNRPPGWLRGGLFRGNLAAVYGQATAAVPSGVARTVTGGRRWTPVASRPHGPLLGGAFRTWREGYLLGPDHRILGLTNLKQPANHPADIDAEVALRCGEFVTPDAFWAAGDNALLLRRQPGDQPWSVIPLDLPSGTRRLADFRTLATDGSGRAWLAGGLTGLILHTPDTGKTWRALAAPKGGTVQVLHHLRDDTLIAGGTGGRIWVSDDGGTTWTRRHGRDRPDVLFVAAATDISIWPAVVAHARAGAECVVVFVTTPPSNGWVAPAQSLRAAALQAGARGSVVLTEFPSHVLKGQPRLSEKQMLSGWSLQLDVDASRSMVRQLAAAIRLLRPRVLATGPTTTHRLGNAGEARLVARLAHQALHSAADPNETILAGAKLDPHSPRRVFEGDEFNDSWQAPWEKARRRTDRDATTTLSLSRFPAGANTSLELLAQEAMWCLDHLGPLDRPARVQIYRARHKRRTRADRPLFTTALVADPLPLASNISPQRRSLASMAHLRMGKALGRTGGALAHLARTARQVRDDPLAADRLMLAWWRLLEERDFPRAREARDLFLRHGSKHPMFSRGVALALAMKGSAEWKTLDGKSFAPDGVRRPLRVDAAASALTRSVGWRDDPGVRMVLASALAAENRAEAARKQIESVKDGPFDPHWTIYAGHLLGQDDRDARVLPRRTVSASSMASPGKLDGRLDERVWLKTKPLALRPGTPAAKGLSGTVRLLRSPTHLLVGLELPRQNWRAWTVDLALDTDRDAATQIIITFDSTGKKSVELRTRFGPAVGLPTKPILLQGRKGEEMFTFEVAVPLSLMGWPVQKAGECNFQIRGQAKRPGKEARLYLTPLRGLEAIHRYAKLKLPAPKKPQANR